MSHLKSSLGLRLGATVFFVLMFIGVSAQVQTPRHVSINGNCGGFYEYLPQGYNSSETYPLIIYIHGLGELGNGGSWELPRVLNNGIPKLIQWGQFPASFNSGGQNHRFIVISPQFVQWPSANDINAVVNYAVQHYRVNANRIYVTGISMGGGLTWEYGSSYASRVAAMVPVCGASWPDPTRAQQIAAGRVAVWATHNNGDGVVPVWYTNDYITHINNSGANPSAKKSIWNSTSHDAWSQTYDPNYRENGMNIYEWMLQYTKGNATPPPPPPAPTAVSLPGRVEAEAFSAQSGVQTEATGDAGGGQNVGWIDQNDWMDYLVNPSTTGAYTVRLRVATPNNGGQLQIRRTDGTVLSTVSIPNTGGYQAYQTVTATLNLTAGSQTLRVVSTAWPGWNFNWMEYAHATATAPTPVASNNFKVEAEAFSSQQGVQTENTQDAGGGQNVGWIDQNDWMDYSINPSVAGTYTVKLRIATPNGGAQLQIRRGDGSVLSTVTLPNTGGYQAWQTVTTTLSLAAGVQTIRVVSTAWAGWNFNWLEFNSGSSTPPPPAPTGNTRIEAENFTAQHGVQAENTWDAGGGQNVGWIDNGDWMDYSYNAPAAGTYTMNFRIATPNTGGQFQVRKSDGSVLATVNLPNTGGYQNWQTVSVTVNLAAGSQTLRIVSTAWQGWNFNWFELNQGGATVTTVTPQKTRIEAETFVAQQGIQTEGTWDAGGGQNVGWIDQNDWMDYNYTAPAAGTYTVSFRVAAPHTGAQLQLRSADGSVLATVNVPNTGGWQSFQTVSAQVTLAAGAQRLRVVSTAWAGWNFNWFEVEGPVSGSVTSTGRNNSDVEIAGAANAASVEMYPNPVQDKLVLKLNNELTGAVKVIITGVNGVVVKEFNFSKGSKGQSQFYLTLAQLPAGSYLLTVQMNQWKETKQLIKK